jgi:hypothetical protein
MSVFVGQRVVQKVIVKIVDERPQAMVARIETENLKG